LKRVKVYRQVSHKPKVVYSIRISDEDDELLKSYDNVPELFHNFLEELKSERRTLEAKGTPIEIVKEIAEAYAKIFIEKGESRKRLNIEKGWEEEDELELWNNSMSGVLLDVAELTLKTPSPFTPASIYYPNNEQLEDVLSHLQSKEARAFIQKIKDNIDHATIAGGLFLPEEIVPLSEDEIDLIRKIFDETKYLIEQQYRKKFHKLPPEDWHVYITDSRKPAEPKKLRYQLP